MDKRDAQNFNEGQGGISTLNDDTVNGLQIFISDTWVECSSFRHTLNANLGTVKFGVCVSLVGVP